MPIVSEKQDLFSNVVPEYRFFKFFLPAVPTEKFRTKIRRKQFYINDIEEETDDFTDAPSQDKIPAFSGMELEFSENGCILMIP